MVYFFIGPPCITVTVNKDARLYELNYATENVTKIPNNPITPFIVDNAIPKQLAGAEISELPSTFKSKQ